jgi:hypothetical protein
MISQQRLAQAPGGPTPWAVTTETSERITAARPAMIPMADVARVRRATQAVAGGV